MPIGQLGMLGISTGLGAAKDAIGMIGQKRRENRSLRNTKNLMEIQQSNQMELNQQGADLAKKQWDETNYEAQREHMEKAGLNVGLMYGMGGSGGVTANAGSGGSASMGSAPSPQPMELGSALQNALLMNQAELIKAQTEKTKVETAKTSGVDTENVQADTALKQMNTANAEIQNTIGNKTLEQAIDGIKANYDKAQSEARSALVTANVDENTQKEKEKQIRNEAIQSAVQIGVMKQGIKLSEAQIQNMAEQIAIGKYNAEKVGTDQVLGKQLNSLVEKIYGIFGINNEQISK